MKTNDLLQEFIKLSLQESTRSDREGIKLTSEWDELKKYVDKGCFIHFGELNKLGINPHSVYSTPLGIYTYPLIKRIYDQFQNDGLPFADDQKYIHILKPTNPEKIINLTQMSIDDAVSYSNDFIEASGNVTIQQFESSQQFIDLTTSAKIKTPGGRFWYITFSICKNKPVLWNKNFRAMNADGFVDFGSKIIHPNEPTQAVFFAKNIVEQLEVIWNPKFKKERKRAIEILRSKDSFWPYGGDSAKIIIASKRKFYDFVKKYQKEGYGVNDAVAEIEHLVLANKDDFRDKNPEVVDNMYDINRIYNSKEFEDYLKAKNPDLGAAFNISKTDFIK